MSERIPSPAATGGAGDIFEQHVDAFALSLLLTSHVAPVLLDCKVVAVHLQTRHIGWRTDDLLLVGEVEPGRVRKLVIQAKRSFVVSEKNDDCVKAISSMWNDFRSADLFDPTRDRLAIAVQVGKSALLYDLVSLLECSRAAATSADFRHRLSRDGYLSAKAKAQNASLQTILRSHAADSFDEDVYWQFLRVLTVLHLDLATDTSLTAAGMLSLLAHVVSDGADPVSSARSTWTQLVEIAGLGRPKAQSFVGRESLPLELRQRHHGVQTGDESAFRNLVAHGRVLRDSIRTTLAHSCNLQRTALTNALRSALVECPVVIVVGTPGAGKSALVAAALKTVEGERPVLAFQAVEFATPHLNDTLRRTQTDLSATALVSLLAAHDQTTIFIDGVERLLEHSTRYAFTQLLNLANTTKSLRLILTCRDYSVETVRSSLLEPTGLASLILEVGSLSDDELNEAVEQAPSLKVPLALTEIRDLLRTPYLLDMASRLDWGSGVAPKSASTFREKVWRELVRDNSHSADGMPSRRENTFIAVSLKRATELRPYVKIENADLAAVELLCAAAVLSRSSESTSLLAPAHDVMEDWAVLHSLDAVAQESDDLAADLAQYTSGLPALRRGLRRWLGERLELDKSATCALLLDISSRSELPLHFRDDCIVAALLSDSAFAFVDGCRGRIAAGDSALLIQMMHLLRVACKATPAWASGDTRSLLLLLPSGKGWPATLELLVQNVVSFDETEAILCLGLVEDWARQVSVATEAPQGAESAGEIASLLIPRFQGYRRDDALKRLLGVILTIPKHARIFPALLESVENGASDNETTRELAEQLISTMGSAFVCRDFPEAVISHLRMRLLLDETEQLAGYESAVEVDRFFGVRDLGINGFFPASALQGPWFSLFRHHPHRSLKFVIELMNHAGEWYGLGKSDSHELEPAEVTMIDIPDAASVRVWANWRLYALSRGLHVGPYSLQCALMALEAWLLRVARSDSFDLDGWLLYVLGSSNNAMLASVAASVCIAYPMRAKRTSLALLGNRTLIQLDRQRMAMERSTGAGFLAGLNPAHGIYEEERRTSNALAHRREDLEMLALRMQTTQYREEVWALLDKHRAELPAEQDDETRVWRIALHRMDIRGFRQVAPPSSVSIQDAEVAPDVYLAPGALENDVQLLVDESAATLSLLNRHLQLKHSAESAWAGATRADVDHWRTLFASAQALAEEEAAAVPEYARGGPAIVAAVSVRDRFDELTIGEKRWCVSRVERELSPEPGEAIDIYSRSFGADRAAAAVLCKIVAEVPRLLSADASELLARVMTSDIDDLVGYVYRGAALLGSQHSELVLRIASAAIVEAEVRFLSRVNERPVGAFGLETSDSTIRARGAVREVITIRTGEVRPAISSLDMETWEGRRATLRLCTLFEHSREVPELRALLERGAQWLATTWGRDKRGRNREQRDYHFEHELSRTIATYAIGFPPAVALVVCAPIINLVKDFPDEVKNFVTHLVSAADANHSGSFWPIWDATVREVLQSGWVADLDQDRASGGELVTSLFLNTDWREGTRHWIPLDGNAFRIHELVTSLPPTAICTQAYLQFLNTVGWNELPASLVTLDALFQRGGGFSKFVTKSNVFYLESILSHFVYAQPVTLKRGAALRAAVLHLLDSLVLAGSSAAYRMRDDFVTPYRAED